jgi:hypothetical protein
MDQGDIPTPLRLTEHGFDNFELYMVKVQGDGNCWFHGLCMSFYKPYRTRRHNGVAVSRSSIVRTLRRDLSVRLTAKADPNDKNSPIIYDTLSKGQLREFGPEYSLEGMMKHLDSSEHCGEEVQEFVSNELNKNIFYIDRRIGDVYTSSNELLYRDRPSVVLLYTGDHYDVCALRENGQFITHFSFDNPFIQFLYRRLMEKKRV